MNFFPKLIFTFLIIFSFSFQAKSEEKKLDLVDVFNLIEENHPELRAANLENQLARAVRKRALSSFVPGIRNRFFIGEFEDKDRKDKEVIANSGEISWQSPFALEFFGGFRTTTGDSLASEKLVYPGDSKAFLDTVWKQELLTPATTEGIFGLRVPILEGLFIDKFRTDLKTSKLEQSIAGYKIAEKRAKLYQKAGELYWAWLKEGINYQITENLLELAKNRESFVKKSVDTGLSPEIAYVEVQSQILSREAKTRFAEQKFKQASVKLSNFLWQDRNSLFELTRDSLPTSIQNPKQIPEVTINGHKSLAIQRRPEVQNINLKIQQLRAELKLARNQLLPKLDFEFTATQDISGVDSGTAIRGSVVSDIPIIPLKEMAKVQALEAKINQLQLKRQNMETVIQNEIEEALIGMQKSQERVDINSRSLEMLERLAEGEKTRYKLGNSTLFLINQRETALNNANIELTNALSDFQVSLNKYQFAIGELSDPVDRSNWYILLEEGNN